MTFTQGFHKTAAVRKPKNPFVKSHTTKLPDVQPQTAVAQMNTAAVGMNHQPAGVTSSGGGVTGGYGSN